MPRLLVHGMFRSGTTLLSRMLGAPTGHLVVADPFVYVFKAYRAFLHQRYGARRVERQEPTSDWFLDPDSRMHARFLAADMTEAVPGEFLERMRQDLIDWKSVQHPRLVARVGDLGRAAGCTFADVLRQLLDLCGELYGDGELELLGAKLSWCDEFLPAATRALPGLRLLLITRDVRAVAASQDHQRGPGAGKRPLLFYARHWRKSVGFARHLMTPGVLPAGTVAHLRFEDLVEDPERSLRVACADLGLGFDPDMLRSELYRDPSEGGGWRDNSSFASAGQGVLRTAKDRWRSRLDPGARRSLEALCGPELAWMGYPLPREVARPLERLAAAGEPSPQEVAPWLREQGACASLSDPIQRLLDYGYEELRRQAIEGLPLDPAVRRELFPLPDSLARLRGAWQVERSAHRRQASGQLDPVA